MIEYKKTHSFDINGKHFVLSAEFDYFDNVQSFLDAEQAAIDTRSILSRYDNPLVDVSWSIFYGNNYPSTLPARDRAKMLIEFRKIIKDCLANGIDDKKPQPGIIVVAYPWGSKIDLGPTLQSQQLGKKNRIAFAKSCADFSDPTSDGWMLARYNDQCKIEKININE